MQPERATASEDAASEDNEADALVSFLRPSPKERAMHILEPGDGIELLRPPQCGHVVLLAARSEHDTNARRSRVRMRRPETGFIVAEEKRTVARSPCRAKTPPAADLRREARLHMCPSARDYDSIDTTGSRSMSRFMYGALHRPARVGSARFCSCRRAVKRHRRASALPLRMRGELYAGKCAPTRRRRFACEVSRDGGTWARGDFCATSWHTMTHLDVPTRLLAARRWHSICSCNRRKRRRPLCARVRFVSSMGVSRVRRPYENIATVESIARGDRHRLRRRALCFTDSPRVAYACGGTFCDIGLARCRSIKRGEYPLRPRSGRFRRTFRFNTRATRRGSPGILPCRPS